VIRHASFLCLCLVVSCTQPVAADDASVDSARPADVTTDEFADLVETTDATADSIDDRASDDAKGPDGSSCDADDDGHMAMSCGGDDCDDENPDVYPGAVEACDGVDENCDGNADRLADGGFDPLADMPCVDRYSEGGSVVRAPHCYLRGQTTPCGQISTAFPYDGACYGCWQRSGQPVSCAEWCSGTTICSGSCDPTF
jgi:hypothetical protein